MKRLFAFLALLSLPFLVAADAPSQLGSTGRVGWTAPTTNADGTPCTDLAGYVLAVTSPAVDLATGGTPLATLDVPGAATTEVAVTPLFAGRSVGQYRLWVRAKDLTGNPSAWSAPLLVSYDGVAPGVPSGLKITVTVVVEVP